jgi:hypothetical protein
MARGVRIYGDAVRVTFIVWFGERGDGGKVPTNGVLWRWREA